MAAAFCGCASGFGRAAESHFCTQCLKWLCKWLCWFMQWLWAGAQWLCKWLWPGASGCALACIGCGEWLCKWLAEWLCKWLAEWLCKLAMIQSNQHSKPSNTYLFMQRLNYLLKRKSHTSFGVWGPLYSLCVHSQYAVNQPPTNSQQQSAVSTRFAYSLITQPMYRSCTLLTHSDGYNLIRSLLPIHLINMLERGSRVLTSSSHALTSSSSPLSALVRSQIERIDVLSMLLCSIQMPNATHIKGSQSDRDCTAAKRVHSTWVHSVQLSFHAGNQTRRRWTRAGSTDGS